MDKDKNLSIKHWSLDDRPREKLLKKGIESLSDAELIAVLIGSGNRTESAVELSKKILASVDNNLNGLARLSVHDLMNNFSGIGEAKGISIVAALELGRRRKLTNVLNKKRIRSSKEAADILMPMLSDLGHEEFWVIFMNNKNMILDKQRVSMGGIDSTITDVRIILKKALDIFATSLVLVHNHPSGSKEPSKHDYAITRKMKSAGDALDIHLMDHIIVVHGDYFSFADEDKL
jgi:DNA repair protein RadC